MDYDYAALLRPRCKVCSSTMRQGSSTMRQGSSTMRQEIDLRLMGKELRDDGERYSYEQILDYAEENGLKLSKAGLSRHRTEHLMPDVLSAIETQRQVEAIAQATGQTLGMETAYLNMLVSRAMKKLSETELSDDGKWLATSVRAIEALLKVRKAELHFSAAKIAEADKAISAAGKAQGMAPETLRMIREQLYGLVDSTPDHPPP